MDIFVISKRQYTNRDLLDDRYGRLFELPEALARRGHRVRGLTTSYRRRTTRLLQTDAGVQWSSVGPGPLTAWQWLRQIQQLSSSRPDVIWASSDALHCTAGQWLARHWGIPCVLDLYDNYDHFKLTDLPGLRLAYHAACRKASGLTVVSQSLARHIRQSIAPNTPVTVLYNGVATRHFHPMNQAACRQALQLPVAARLMGTTGAIHCARGIDDLFRAFLLLAEADENLHLVIAGPQDQTPAKYNHPRIINFGVLDWRQVPMVINALDVMVVCNRDDSFGRFCHPLKLMEAQACGTVVCASAVGEAALLLSTTPEHLYCPGNAIELAERIKSLLDKNTGKQKLLPTPDWDTLAGSLEQALQQAVSR